LPRRVRPTTNVLKLQGAPSMVAGHGSSWAPSQILLPVAFSRNPK
jgi:hypothetical protein